MNSLIDAYRKCLLLNNSNKLYYLSTSAILSSEVVNTIYRRRVIIWFICNLSSGAWEIIILMCVEAFLKEFTCGFIYIYVYVVHPVNYAHSYGLVWANFTHIIQGYSLARGQSYDSLSVCEATLKNMGEYSVKYLRTIYMKNGTSQFNPYWY